MFIGRKNIKIFKIFIVSPLLEKILLLVFLICIPLLSFYPESFSSYSYNDMRRQIFSQYKSDQFYEINTVNDFNSWVLDTAIPNYYSSQISPNLPIRGMRIRQYRYDSNCLENKLDCLSSLGDLKESEVNFSPQNGLKGCVYPNCDEFKYRFDNINCDKVQGHYGYYPMFGWRADLGLDMNTAKGNFEKIRDNKWIDMKTMAAVIEFNYFNCWTNKFICIRCMVEISGNKVVNKIFRHGLFFYYEDSLYIFIFAIFFMQVLLYILKLMFEFTLICNKFLFVGQTFHLASQFVLCILFIIKISYLSSLSPEDYAKSTENFVFLYRNVQIHDYIKFVFLLIFIIYPFKLFHLISWFKNMSFFIKFTVTIYRTLHSAVLLYIYILVMLVLWSLGFMVLFQDYLIQFKDYTNSLASTFFINFEGIDVNSKRLLFGTFNELFPFVWFLNNLVFLLLICYFICVLTDLFNRSASFEYNQKTPHEKELNEKMLELENKFDRFLNELRNELDKDKKIDEDNDSFNKSQNKILIWLNCNQGIEENHDDLEIQLREANIQAKKFIHTDEVIQFLDYLFKLKPNLLSFRAGERFRIVAIKNNDNNGSRDIETLIEWLKHIGCRVPVLIYSKLEIEADVMLYMKKKYPSIIFVYNIDHLIKFCVMTESISNFLEFLKNEEFREKFDDVETVSEDESYDDT